MPRVFWAVTAAYIRFGAINALPTYRRPCCLTSRLHILTAQPDRGLGDTKTYGYGDGE